MAVRIAVLALAVTSRGAVAAGCWMIWPPLGLLVPGGLVWIDLTIRGLR